MDIITDLLRRRRYHIRLGGGLLGVGAHLLTHIGEFFRGGCQPLCVFGDGLQDMCHIGPRLHLLGDVSRVLDDLEGLVVEIQNRVVGGLQPDFLSPLAQPLILAGFVLATIEALPERPVLRTLLGDVIDKHAVMLARNLFKAVSHGVQEVVIRRDNRTVHLEFNHRLRLANGFNLSGKIGILFG